MFEDDEIDLDVALNGDEGVQSVLCESRSKSLNSNGNHRHNQLSELCDSAEDEVSTFALVGIPGRVQGKRSATKQHKEEPVFKEPKIESEIESSPKRRQQKKSMFPGPAGVIQGTQSQDNNKQNCSDFALTQETKKSTVRELTDDNPAWQHLQHHETVASTADSDSMLNIYNILWARDKSVKTGLTFKTPLIVGAIRSIDLNIGFDSQCELVDATGAIKCMIHRDICEKQKDLLVLPGTVLCLRNVTIMKQSDGKVSGIVTPNNLVSIYFVKNQSVGVKNVSQLTKDDVRRSAARLSRDEKVHSRLLSKTSNHTSINSNIEIQPSNSVVPSRCQISLNHGLGPGRKSSPAPSSNKDSALNSTMNQSNVHQSQKFTFKPKLQPSNVSQIQKYTNSHSEVNPSQAELEATQELLEGLDEDSIFGDF